jgi:hypothetical protein
MAEGEMATTMATDWIALLIAFVGGSLMATVISAFMKHCIFHPVISVRLDEKSGSYGPTSLIYPDGTLDHQVRYFRLHVENTGLSSIKDCSGHITEITKRVWGTPSQAPLDVVDLGWANKNKMTTDIPRGAFFHMDIATLHLLPIKQAGLGPSDPRTERKLTIPRMPTHLFPFFSDKATYEFEILIAADNARPRCVRVKFNYDPQTDELDERRLEPVNKTRYPWWSYWRRLRSRWQERSG